MKRKDSRKGFTIVEVALVLALAGLIFLMVFIVLPSVQRTQRDSQRRDDVGRLLTAITKYQTNNRGSLPSGVGEVTIATTTSDWGDLYQSFLGENFTDPNGDNYRLFVQDCSARAGETCSGDIRDIEDEEFPNGFTMFVVRSAACNGSLPVGSDNPRKVAVVYKMEGAGAYCANTQ